MVKKTRLNVVWDKPASASLQIAYDYIKEDSPVNAERVREAILKITKGLSDHPEKYPPDKFKEANVGNYRAFEKYSYRVAYKITEQEIIILRVRHVKQEPKGY
jgi:plasmid stabilization system protein ParE